MRNKRKITAILTMLFVIGVPFLVLADELIADGDGLTPVASNALSFGNVAAGASSDKDVLLVIKRTTSGSPNIFDGGSTPTVTSSPPGDPNLTISMPDSAIALPGNWETQGVNSLSSDTARSRVRLSVPAGTASGAKSTTITFTASGTAANGSPLTRTANVTVTYTVTDGTPPVLTLPADITREATGSSGAVVTFTATALDAADGVRPVTSTPASGSTFPVGTTTVNCSASDTSGNTVTGSFKVTVQDTVKPVFSSVPANVSLEATGEQTPAAIGSAVATDLFPVTITNDAPENGYPLGTTTVTWTATDANGNTSTATQTVTISDTTAPTLTLPANITVEAEGPAGAAADFSPSATDLVDGSVTAISTPSSGATFPLGTTPVNVTATDSQGNIASGSFTVTVQDTTAPELSLPENMTLEATGVSGAAAVFGPTALDLVDGSVEVTTAPPSGSVFPMGTTTVSVSAVDTRGNTATGSFNVTVADTTGPVISAPADISQEASALLTPVTIGTATATDIFNPITITSNAPATYPLGDTTVTWTAVDANGNSSTATQVVTVTDTTNPVITAPGPVTQEADAVLSTVEIGTATATDIFGPVAVTSNAPATYPLGDTTVTWTATDANGNSSTATQLITIVDTTVPEISAPADISEEATAVLSPVSLGTASASDIFTVTVTNDAPEAFPLGTTVVTWTAEDTSGNTSTATQRVTLSDTIAPVITAPADITAEASAVLSPVALTDATATDIFPVTITNDAPEAFPLGVTTVTWTAKDSSGNTSTATQQVTVTDTTAPEITAPGPVTHEADAVLSTVSIGTATATDIFNPVTVTSDAPATYPLGDTTVTWTATDANGNSSTATQIVTVTDTTGPAITLPADVTQEADATLSAVEIGTATAADIFGPVTLSNDAPAAYPLGTTTVTWTAVDANGNSSTASQKITVIDTTEPEITVPDNISQEADAVLSTVEIGTATAQDIFEPVTVTNDAPAVYPLGTTTVTWTATDANGNVGTATQLITLVDTTEPEITAPTDISLEATAVLTPVTIGTASGTDIFDVTITSDAPAAFPLGTTTVTWTAKDTSGNTSTATQKITVTDTTDPVITAPAAVTREATAALTPAVLGTATATDIFTPVAISSDAPAAFPVGTTTVIWTATDPNGNSSTAAQSVTITDTTGPIVTPPANIVVDAATAAGTPVTFSATATDLVDGALPVTSAPPSGHTFPAGNTTVLLSATDANGNSTSGSFTVSVHYKYSGILQPINVNGSSIFKQGSTIPVKFQLKDTAGNAITNAAAKIYIAKISSGIAGTEVEAISTSAATTGNLFRYDPTDRQYIFNLGTKGMTIGTYQLRIDLGDGTVNTVNISLK